MSATGRIFHFGKRRGDAATQSRIGLIGHADLVESADGSWFVVFLGIRPNGYPPCYHLGRETFLAPVTWAEDGFPVMGDNGRISLEMETSLTPHAATKQPVRDDFNSAKLALDWDYLRNPDLERYSLDGRAGHLRLRGGAPGLDDLASPTWVGRRQC